MKQFLFINNFEEKFDDFKKFIENSENMKSIDVTYNIGKEVTLMEISNISTLISNVLVEDTSINLVTNVNENLNKNDIIVKIEIKED